MDETVRENLSKYVGTAAFIVAGGVILLAQILPEVFGVTLPITKLFPKYGDARTALIRFILGLCACAAFPPLFWIQLENLRRKFDMTWSFVVLFAAFTLSILSFIPTVVFLFHSRDALERFHYPVFSEGTLYFAVYGYTGGSGYVMRFVYERAVKIVSKVRKYVKGKKNVSDGN
jgi:hypothetical protein